MTAACFGCGGRFERAQLEEVGDTVFCAACLARMLRRIDERGAIAGPTALTALHVAPASRMPELPPADPPCFICDAPLEGTAFVELRGFSICAACSRGLLSEEVPAAAASALVANDDRPIAGLAGPDDPARHGAVRPRVIETPGAGTEWCSGCGRAMPGPGSYQVVDGRPHCAACVAQRRPTPRDASTDAPGIPEICDACRRPAAPSTLRDTRGFALCLACLDSDAALALALAQAHHRRRLARAGRRILDGGDDD